MQNVKTNLARRQLLKGFVAIPFVTLAGYHSSASAEMLSVDDPFARSRNYVRSSSVTGQSCANCKLFVKKGSESGRCAIFSGKEVANTGLCDVWIAR